MTIVKNAYTGSWTATYKQNEKDTCIIAKSPGHFKCTKITVGIEDYNNLRNKLTNPKNTKNFFRSSGNLGKAECELLKKKLSVLLVNSKCYFFSSTNQATDSTSASRASKSSNIFRNRKKRKTKKFYKKHFGGSDSNESLEAYFYILWQNFRLR